LKYLINRNDFIIDDFLIFEAENDCQNEENDDQQVLGFFYNKRGFFKKIDFFNFFLFEKFLKILIKNGLKLKFLKFILSSFNLFFFLFLFNSGNFFKRYQNTYNIYYFFSKTTSYFFNVNYIFN
jgi:hypothetical protein